MSAIACGDDPTFVPCRDIPAGGCPHTRGASCESDPTCRAIYTCEDQKWIVETVCPEITDSGAVTPDAAADSGVTFLERDASFVAPPGASGGPGCADLEPPDCTLSLALACSADQCCGCEELYVCDNGGWIVWGTCNAGVLTAE